MKSNTKGLMRDKTKRKYEKTNFRTMSHQTEKKQMDMFTNPGKKKRNDSTI